MHGCSWPRALLLLLVLPLHLAAERPWPRCPTWSANYSAASIYEANLINLISSLQQNASSSASLFASGSLGATPDTVYGVMLCRGDVNVSDCFECGTSAIRDTRTACSRRSRDVALCYNECYIRLSDVNFLASTDNSGEISVISDKNISSSDIEGYNHAVSSLLIATVEYAVQNSTRLFATGEWVGPDPGSPHIYSAAQCAADLSPEQCQNCLKSLLVDWWNKFHENRDGVRIAGARCTFRYEVGKVPFYAGGAMLLLPRAKGSSFWKRSGSEEAVKGLESGARRSEKRTSSGGQAQS